MEVDHLPPSSTEVEYGQSCTSVSSLCLHWHVRGDLCLYIIMCNLLLFSIFVSSYCTAAANCMKASSSEGRLKFHLIMSTPTLLTANSTTLICVHDCVEFWVCYC